MNNFKYLLQFILIIFLFSIFKIIGLRYSSILSEKIFILLGPLVRSGNLISKNLSIAFPNFNSKQKTEIQKKMWSNYGKIFAEYMFIKDFRKSSNFLNNIIIENQNELDQVKTESKPVIFVSGPTIINSIFLEMIKLNKLLKSFTSIFTFSAID